MADKDDMLREIQAKKEAERQMMAEAREKFDTTADTDEYEYYYGEDVNPWITMWFRPKYTMRHILDNEPWYSMFFVALMAAVASSLMGTFSSVPYEIDWDLTMIVVMAICPGAIVGVVSLFVQGFAYQWIGTVLGGKARATEVVSALAWSEMPMIVLLPYMLFLIVVHQEYYFYPGWDVDDPESVFEWLQEPTILTFAILSIVFTVWGGILRVLCLAEAQQYSFVQAIINIVLGEVVLLTGVWILMMSPLGMALALFAPAVAGLVIPNIL